MGGCGLFFLLMPILMGFGIVLAFFAVALPLYAAGALCFAILLVVAYALLARHGIFARYLGEAGWPRAVALVAQWTMRLAIPVLVVSAVASLAIWLFYYQGIGR